MPKRLPPEFKRDSRSLAIPMRMFMQHDQSQLVSTGPAADLPALDTGPSSRASGNPIESTRFPSVGRSASTY